MTDAPGQAHLLSGRSCCVACLRRSWLLAWLAPHIDVVWKRRRPLRDVLALDDGELIDALAGAQRDAVRARRAAFDAGDALQRCDQALLTPVCVHARRFPQRLRTGPG